MSEQEIGPEVSPPPEPVPGTTEETVGIVTGEDLESTLPFIAGPPPPPPGPGEPAATAGPGARTASTAGSAHGKGHHGAAVLRSPFEDGAAMVKSVGRDLGSRSVWVLGATAILIAFVISWFASFLSAFRHGRGITAQARILDLFSPGTFGWALAVLLAVALVSAGRRFDMGATTPGIFNDGVAIAAFLAACAVGGSALIGCLVELTNFGNGIDTALSGLVAYVGVLPIAAAATWWAHRLHNRVA